MPGPLRPGQVRRPPDRRGIGLLATGGLGLQIAHTDGQLLFYPFLQVAAQQKVTHVADTQQHPLLGGLEDLVRGFALADRMGQVDQAGLVPVAAALLGPLDDDTGGHIDRVGVLEILLDAVQVLDDLADIAAVGTAL